MTQTSQAAPGKVTKLNRVERNAWTKRKIFDAATKIVGKYVYAEASVARITEAAGVAQGTFYNHFENRQELLDQLLPKIGIDMVRFIRERTGTPQTARQEIERFSAFFDFIREVPEFLRILNEAEFFAPIGYQKHFDNISTAYVRILKRARLAGTIEAYSDEEFEAIVQMLMGARGYLSRRYSYSGGENIASSEVERVIYELPQVREVAVIGMRDERWGETPVAIVVLAEHAALELPDLTDHCRARLAGFKIPKQLIIRDSLPRNPSGKVLKRVLRAELEAHA